ncbi:MAG TPA: hypothetical protein VGL38_07335 [bacterium]|jgi:hypothetical protein
MSGPKSPEGKARSRSNALKHGLRATDELFLTHLKRHEREVFADFRTALHREYKPKTAHEKLLVDQIAIQHFRQYRLYDLEYLATSKSRHDPLATESIFRHLDRLSRYDTRISQQLRALHNRLKSLYWKRDNTSLSTFNPKE